MNAAVVAIDLAIRRHRDIGLIVLARRDSELDVHVVECGAWGDPPDPIHLAEVLAVLAGKHAARCIIVDGPQAWRDPDGDPGHQRECERVFRTPGKTGPPGVVLPRTWKRFAEFSIALFDALDEHGWPRLPATPGAGPLVEPIAVETFPTAGWRRLGLPVLPAGARCSEADVRTAARALARATGLPVPASVTHDQLQAIVAGLGGLALAEGRDDAYACAGSPPRRVHGAWREGFIVVPRATTGVTSSTISSTVM